MIIDLRSAPERLEKPDRVPANVERVYFRPASANDPAGVTKDLIAGRYTADEVHALKKRNYLGLLESGRGAYREIFLQAATGDRLLFHCAGGRDRAGVGAALVLLTVGVDRETVIADYLLTNDARAAKSAEILRNSAFYGIAESSLDALVASWTADVAYLEPVLDRIDEEYGGITRYVTEQLGIDPQSLERVRTHLIE